MVKTLYTHGFHELFLKSSNLQCGYCIVANRSQYIISVLHVILYVKGLGVLGFHDKGLGVLGFYDKGIGVQCGCGKCLGIVLSGL